MITRRDMTRARRAGASAVLAVVLTLATTHGLAAQAEPDSVHLRNECRLAQQVLATGHPGPQRANALGIINRCGAAVVVPTLVSLWTGPVLPRADLQLLVTATRDVVSPALVDALLRAAEEPGRSAEHRVGALLVLTTWADSAALPGFGDLLGPPERVLVNRFGHVDHSFAPIVLEPLTGPVMPRLRAALEHMKAGDPNPELRTAARALLANLDAMAPTPPGSP